MSRKTNESSDGGSFRTSLPMGQPSQPSGYGRRPAAAPLSGKAARVNCSRSAYSISSAASRPTTSPTSTTNEAGTFSTAPGTRPSSSFANWSPLSANTLLDPSGWNCRHRARRGVHVGSGQLVRDPCGQHRQRNTRRGLCPWPGLSQERNVVMRRRPRPVARPPMSVPRYLRPMVSRGGRLLVAAAAAQDGDRAIGAGRCCGVVAGPRGRPTAAASEATESTTPARRRPPAQPSTRRMAECPAPGSARPGRLGEVTGLWPVSGTRRAVGSDDHWRTTWLRLRATVS